MHYKYIHSDLRKEHYPIYKKGNYFIWLHQAKKQLCVIEEIQKEGDMFKIRIIGDPDIFSKKGAMGTDIVENIPKKVLIGYSIPKKLYRDVFPFNDGDYIKEFKALRYLHACQNNYPDVFSGMLHISGKKIDISEIEKCLIDRIKKDIMY